MPALIATSLLEEEEGEFDGDGSATEEGVTRRYSVVKEVTC